MIIHVAPENRFELSSTSKGNQTKWFQNNKYIKADMFGYESIAEVLVSELLLNTRCDFGFANYFLCRIIEGSHEYRGCLSENFLSSGESLVSVGRLIQGSMISTVKFYKQYVGKNLLSKVLEIVKTETGLDCYEYLRFIVYLDALILNEDRHLNNISLVYNKSTDSYRFAPVFDNGLSLLSDTREYPMSSSAGSLINTVKSKPFSTSFRKQVDYFEPRLLTIDFDNLLKSLDSNDSVFSSQQYLRAKNLLIARLRQTEGYLWERA